eukprot:CAMPEP_0170617044 /NCGR_PEP_ID=MMETSP0224-20130122/26196_1 /TAXON_ID=285029 /ORGANISM="Togula jolla, Strain CCCM 725" /LENGTH=435 /DNA_ID=CAMNT_0010942887 /DNA_START=45 /DNA_END=1352 /DNA_ORIENTATION=-
MEPAFGAGHFRRSKPIARPGSTAPSKPIKDELVVPEIGNKAGTVATIDAPWLSEDELFSAVSSLYDDELKPYLCTLKSRLNEGRAKGQKACDLNASILSGICRKSPRLLLQQDHCSDYFLLLRGREANFVDVLSPIDVYPPELWDQMAQFFESPEGAAMEMPGGRYACAKVLMDLDLPFLDGYSLGQVSHITQLAIRQKNILGYSSYSTGAIVPYVRSAALVKSTCADMRCSVASTSAANQPQLPVASWEQARLSVQEILMKSLGSGTSCILLSNIKRMIRSEFEVDLSETALGHAKLSELLTDSRFHDICDVQMQGRSYVVVPSQYLLESMGLPAPLSRLRSSKMDSGVHGRCDHDGHSSSETARDFPFSPALISPPPGLSLDEKALHGHFSHYEKDFHLGGGCGGCGGRPLEVAPASRDMNNGGFVSLTRLSL